MDRHALPTILAWLEDPPSNRGISYADARAWHHVPYRQLAARAASVASGLRERGIGRDDVVSILLPNGPTFVEVIVGALVCGATTSPVASPAAFSDATTYADHVAAIVS